MFLNEQDSFYDKVKENLRGKAKILSNGIENGQQYPTAFFNFSNCQPNLMSSKS